MSAQHTHARTLLVLIRGRIARREPPISGYGVAASLIDLDGETHARTFGQVCSRIDAASFAAGFPMLASHMIRKPDGKMNPASFGPDWATWADEIKSIAESHTWTVEQVDEDIGALDGLPRNAAIVIWNDYLKREAQTPGFVRYNLHRKLKLAK
jgi:hypothetical protein